MMNYKNSIKSLAIFSVILATLTLLCSWEPLIPKPLFSSNKRSSIHANSTSVVHKDELEVALEKASMANKTVIITIINEAYVEPHKDEYPTMFDLFLEGFWVGEGTRQLAEHLLVVAMDEKAYERCRFRRMNCYKLAVDDGGEGGGEKMYMTKEFIDMMWRRTLFLLDVLKRGYNFVFTDTDILWLRNPFTGLSKNETWDLQISTDAFNGKPSSVSNLINTGFYFIRSNNKTISLFETWYGSRANSTGLKEQDVLLKLIHRGVLAKLGLGTRFLDTDYFSGFCRDSKNVRLVATVHANCCRSIGAKVLDLKMVLKDWKSFKLSEEIGRSNGNVNVSTSYRTRNFRWSKHRSCRKSWFNTTTI